MFALMIPLIYVRTSCDKSYWPPTVIVQGDPLLSQNKVGIQLRGEKEYFYGLKVFYRYCT